jgi:hypothetical protein
MNLGSLSGNNKWVMTNLRDFYNPDNQNVSPYTAFENLHFSVCKERTVSCSKRPLSFKRVNLIRNYVVLLKRNFY